MASALTALDAVRARIAAALLAPVAMERVGGFVLRESQRRTVRMVHAALARFGGALVADAAGSGKTILALATAAAYDDVLVIAPAAVREQWRRAATRAQVSVRIATLETLSRGRAPRPAALIVVDEAHHVRNPATARYRALATLVSGRHLLLLSATPVVNRRRDRDALLALFLGRTTASASILAHTVIRSVAPARATAVRVLDALPTGAQLPSLAAALRRLPPPFPTADGAAATALVRITLAFAWASSLAALDHALRRRLQRGATLADALRDGRWPTRDALRDWVQGRDATQLAFAFAPPDATRTAPQDALATLDAHLAGVRALRALVAPHAAADTLRRADALRELVARESPRRVVLLAHHAETVRALYAALRHLPGTVAIIGSRVHAAAGRWSRDEILQRVGPAAAPARDDDIRDVRLLLATDILAEGVELQGCATLVHGDAAWTPARLEQRVGRLARDGQRAVVHVTQFAIPPAAERMLALGTRLQRKRSARTRALATADRQAAMRDALAAWTPASEASLPRGHGGPRCAAAWAPHPGFIALLAAGSGGDAGDGDRAGSRDADGETAAPLLVAGVFRDGRWQVGAQSALVEACVRAAGDAAPLTPGALNAARAQLCRWRRREQARRMLSTRALVDPLLLRRAVRQLDAWLTEQPLARRSAAAARVAVARTSLQQLRGIAAERALASALRETTAGDFVAAVERLAAPVPTGAAADLPAIVSTSARTPAPEPWSTPAPARRLSALLILRPRSPASHAPRGSAPESAATR